MAIHCSPMLQTSENNLVYICLPARAGPIKISPHDLPQLSEQNPWVRNDT